MTDMTDKLSFINRDDKGYIIGVGNLVGCSYAEARKRADEIIKNTYRTLLTRGMKGCYIYCTDPGMASYLKSRLEKVKHEATDN